MKAGLSPAKEEGQEKGMVYDNTVPRYIVVYSVVYYRRKKIKNLECLHDIVREAFPRV